MAVFVVSAPKDDLERALLDSLPPEKIAKYRKGRSKRESIELKCSYLMTVGTRRGGKHGSYNTGNPGKRVKCPVKATRVIGGQPFCNEHAPAPFRIDPFYRSKHWYRLRAVVLERDNHACRYCGLDAQTADHVVPRSKGGADAVENLVACCRKCNKIAGGSLHDSFDDKKRWILRQRV